MNQALVPVQSHPILRRAPIAIPDTPAALLGESQKPLAERAKEILGYTMLKVETTVVANFVAVVKALQELRIEPFTNKSVEQYKTQELWRAASPWQKYSFWTAVAIIGLVMGSFMVYLDPPDSAATSRPYFLVGPIGVILAIVSVVVGIGAFMGRCIRGTPVFGWQWYWSDVKESRQEIPPAILEMAIAIKEKCPTVFRPNQQNFITVHSLQREHRVADPFLAITLSTSNGYKHIYVACWDEPRYDARVH